MKKFTILLFVMLLGSIVSLGQITAMFVNDNSVDEESTETIYKLLEQNLGVLPYFNAVDSARSPSTSEMQDFNLVIWYCGADEDDLYFWNNNNQDNPNLEAYLDNGGSLWTMGSGFLNARFIKPPRDFKSGTFLHDYLGVKKWSSETYTNDNGFGVPELASLSGSPVNTITLDIINWEEPPERYVDGCELAEGCSGVYICAPNTYALHGEITAFYFPDSKFKNMTFTFDFAAMDSKGDINNLLSDILRYYEVILSDVAEVSADGKNVTIYPNPATTSIHVDFELTGKAQLKLIDILGNIVKEKNINNRQPGLMSAEILINDLSGGVYFLRIENSKTVISKSLVVAR